MQLQGFTIRAVSSVQSNRLAAARQARTLAWQPPYEASCAGTGCADESLEGLSTGAPVLLRRCYMRLMRRKLGLLEVDGGDGDRALIEDLLQVDY